jgi:hypothetical protein
MDEKEKVEVYKEFKRRVFMESEEVLGNTMVDMYSALQILANLLNVRD